MADFRGDKLFSKYHRIIRVNDDEMFQLISVKTTNPPYLAFCCSNQFLETFNFMHQIDPINRERATGVLVDFCHTNFKFGIKLYPSGILNIYLQTERES